MHFVTATVRIHCLSTEIMVSILLEHDVFPSSDTFFPY